MKDYKNYPPIAVIALSIGVFIFMSVLTVRTLTAADMKSTFMYHFSDEAILEESGSMHESSSPDYWVSSGAMTALHGDAGQTIQGELQLGSEWQLRYALSNPLDTDGGIHPQNIFRLVARSAVWENFQQEAYFKITKYRATLSPNRAAHNGFLFFNRYQDSNNLYYTGIRVDGSAVIKRKKLGTYCTMAYTPGIFPGVYHRTNNPNLLPLDHWIGLRSVVQTLANGSVSINVSADVMNNGQWTLVAQAVDDGMICGSPPILAAGHAGIRTDFMDAVFDRYTLHNL